VSRAELMCTSKQSWDFRSWLWHLCEAGNERGDNRDWETWWAGCRVFPVRVLNIWPKVTAGEEGVEGGELNSSSKFEKWVSRRRFLYGSRNFFIHEKSPNSFSTIDNRDMGKGGDCLRSPGNRDVYNGSKINRVCVCVCVCVCVFKWWIKC
jgi:hypothetical protein